MVAVDGLGSYGALHGEPHIGEENKNKRIKLADRSDGISTDVFGVAA